MRALKESQLSEDQIRNIDPRLLRLRVELYTAAQTLKGDNLVYLSELMHELSVVLDAEMEGRESTIPPVDRSKEVTTDGRPADEVRAEQRAEGNKMHKSYIVLSDDERKRGFVRPVRRSYKHEKCGGVTSMGQAIAETYARDPKFYGATMCVHCGAHFPVGEHGEFVWIDDGSKVGT